MNRRLLPYLLVLLALAALAVGVFGLGSGEDGGDDARSSASSSAQAEKAGDRGVFVAPENCKGPGGRCVWSVRFLGKLGGGRDTGFEDVSCPSPTLCVGVGNERYPSQYVKGGFAVLWNGNRWKTIGTFEGATKTVSCPTSKWCMAIGSDPAEIWMLEARKPSAGGAGWQVEAASPPRPPGSADLALNGVSCTSETSCTIAGISWENGYKNYVARWDGGDWAIQPAPEPKSGVAGATYGMLDVSCASPTFCVTVGEFAYKPFVEQWDGTEWRIPDVPHPTDSPKIRLEGVSCTSSSACMAVGSIEDKSEMSRPYAERWDGSKWSIVEMPVLRREGYGSLRSVSCLSASSCVAVGSVAYPYSGPQREVPVAMAWDGNEWTPQTSPAPKAFSSLAGVSCPPTGACVAVGQAGPDWIGGAGTVALAQRFG